MQASFQIGSSVSLSTGQPARILALTTLFEEDYADVFIEPSGPIQRVLISSLRVSSVSPEHIEMTPAPLFLAKIAAHSLQSLISQQGVLSATNFRITPLPHQILAVDFVLGQFKPRAVIADEVGLGKTIEAAMIFEELKLRRQARRVLIITPAGLTRQWQDELSQKFGEQFVVIDRALFGALREVNGQETNLWTLHDQVITSLDFIKPRRIHPALSERERKRREQHNREIFDRMVSAGWDMVIIDEAHKLSKDEDGTETARYKIGESLSKAVPVFLLLTATPHQGKPHKFLHLLSLVDPLSFTRVEDLQPERVSEIVWRTRKRAALDAQKRPLFKQRVTDVFPVERTGPAFALERELYEKVSLYVSDNYNRALGRNDRAFGFLMILFQRMLTSSSQAITDSLEKRLKLLVRWQEELDEADKVIESPVDFDEQEAGDEDPQATLEVLLDVPGVVNRHELAKEIVIMNDLLNLARRTLKETDSKAAALLEIIDQVRQREGPATKFLIFTEFTATQRVLKKMLEEIGYKVVVINGSMDINERIIARQEFSEDAQFMISTDAGGEGVNLQFCHVMVNYDLPWNPMRLEQRIGRLDRIGQTHNVVVLNLLIGETVEQRVRQVLESKLSIIRKQYGDDKLADILSTLQEEFQFDKLYIEAIAKRQAEATDLERLGEQIVNRARQILDQDDLLLPQAGAQAESYKQKVIEVSPDRIRSLVAGYLAAHGEPINEYSRKQGVYYFDFPEDGSKVRYSDVVFARDKAVIDDSLTFLNLNHPLVQRIQLSLAQEVQTTFANLRLRVGVSSEEPQGLFAVYTLRATNNVDVDRREIISVFLDSNGQSQPRFAKLFLDLLPEQVDSAYLPEAPARINALKEQAWQLAERQSADRFMEIQLAYAEQIESERQKMERYYRQQEWAVRQIAIENIRQAKERELFERRRVDLNALTTRSNLVPDLNLVALAWVNL